MNPSVLIAVMSHTTHNDVPPYADYVSLEKSIRNTWMAQTKNVIVYDYSKDSQLSYDSSSRTLLVPFQGNDMYAIATDKTVKSLRWIAHNLHFDFLFRTNLGSFVHATNLTEWVSDKPKQRYYAGFYDTVRYASGAGILMSRDMVAAVGDATPVPRRVDDAAIVVIMDRLGVAVQPGKRMNHEDGVITEDISPDISDKDRARAHYHWRLRSANRQTDVAMMKQLSVETYGTA